MYHKLHTSNYRSNYNAGEKYAIDFGKGAVFVLTCTERCHNDHEDYYCTSGHKKLLEGVYLKDESTQPICKMSKKDMFGDIVRSTEGMLFM